MVFEYFFKSKKTKANWGNLAKKLNEDMVLIPSGSFLMGSNEGEDDERPIHNALVDSFYLGKYVITQKQWVDLMETRPWQGMEYVRDGDNFPAVNVTWYDTKTFIKKLNKVTGENFRLPTETEWEYACRAGTTTKFIHGNFKLNLSRFAWFYDNAFKKNEMYPHEVGTLKPNKWGLFDMTGNVYQWCSDWYSRNYYNKSPVQNPGGPMYGKYKVVRGGDWARNDYFLRVTCRRYYSLHYKDINVGFRLAKSIEKK